MDYNDYSREQLIEIIKEKQLLNEQLLLEVDRDISTDSCGDGNPGRWYINLKSNTITVNPKRLRTLGLDPAETGTDLLLPGIMEKIRLEDECQIRWGIQALLDGTTSECNSEYRIRTRTGNREFICDNIHIDQYDESGKPLILSGLVYFRNTADGAQVSPDRRSLLPEPVWNDNLTQVKNYRSLILELSAAAEAAGGQKAEPFVLAFLDIDEFRTINETRGRICGNKLLADVAALIGNHIRSCDVVGRYSDDRFMIIFRRTVVKEALSALERVREATESCQFSGGINITVSGGARQYYKEDLGELIDLVEFNLLIAKRCGKNRIL